MTIYQPLNAYYHSSEIGRIMQHSVYIYVSALDFDKPWEFLKYTSVHVNNLSIFY